MKQKLLLFFTALTVLLSTTMLQAQTLHEVQTLYDAYSVIGADLDQDGDMDILGTGRNTDDISWWKNDGSENFTKQTISSSFDGAYDVFVVDMDGDGDLDVVGAADDGFGLITWFKNDGSESFSEVAIWAGGDDTFDAPKSVYAADIDGDGDIDVASIAYNGYVTWWENIGSDSFTRRDVSTGMVQGAQIQIRDINGDNHPDLLVATNNGDKIAWFINNDGSTSDHFGGSITIWGNWMVASSAFSIDIDNDGDIDVVATNSSTDGDISWFENEGGATPDLDYKTLDTDASNGTSVYPADLDGDGDADVLLSQNKLVGGTTYRVTTYINDGSENFGYAHPLSSTTPIGGIKRVYVADVDSDGDMDYLLAGYSDDKIYWYENDADPSTTVTFADGSSFSQSITNSTINQQIGRFQLTASTGTVSLASVKIKLDGSRSGLSNYKLWQSSDASFGSDIQVGTTIEYDPGEGNTVTFKDFVSPIEDATGSDGTYYFLTADAGSFTGSILPSIISNNKVVLSGATHSSTISNDYLFNASGIFSKHSIVSSYGNASSVFSIDLDEDGDMDVLTTSETATDVSWWENDGSESFTQHSISSSINTVKDAYAADIDGDGDIDVITASTGGSGIVWFENDGDESFTQHTIYYNAGSYPDFTSVYAGDIDGDGNMDVAATSYTTSFGNVLWFKNDGTPADGTWDTFYKINSTGYANTTGSVYITDIDADSKLDIIVCVENTDIYWFKNSGTGDYFDDDVSIRADNNNSAYAIDIDNSGKMDVVGISSTAAKVEWHHYATAPSTTTDWNSTQIGSTYTNGLDIFPADINGDGNVDIVTSQNSTNDISWFENDGSESFTQNDIAGSFDNAKSIYSVDLDGDGDMDILAASYDGDEVAWWEQLGAPSTTVDFTNGSGFAPSITLGSANQAIGRFQLTASTGTVGFTSAEIVLTGTRTGLSNFRLWQSTDDAFSSGSDTPLSSAIAYDPGTGNSVSFEDFVSPVESSGGTYYFLTADYTADATGSIQGVVENNSKLTLSGATHDGTIDNEDLSVVVPVTWSGATSSVWNISTNWSSGVVPRAIDIVGITDQANDPVISSGTTAECAYLGIQAGGSLIINADSKLTVSGNLENAGTLTINSTSETASGSLIVEGASTGNVTYNRWMESGSWHIVSAPVETQDISDLLTNVSGTNDIAFDDPNYGVTHYLEGTNAWGTYYTSATGGTFASGKGYLMRRETNGTVSFTGTVADADFTVSIDSTDHAWNALGNPFTSALNANNLADNTDNLIKVNVDNNVLDGSFAALYIWDEQDGYTGNRDDYDVINHAGSGAGVIEQNYIQAGQGFIVKAKDNGLTFNFTRAMQTHQTTTPFKSGEISDWADLNIIAEIEIEDSKISTKTKLKFNSQMTNGLDVGYDAGVLKMHPDFSLFTQLAEDNGVEFMLQCLPTQNLETMEIPIGLDATTGGEISLSIERNNFTETMIPVLNDKLLDAKFAFTADGDIYTTTINYNTKGFGRFSLTFSSTTDAEDLSIEKQHFKAWFSNGKINLYGKATGTEIARVYTISGQEISNTRLENINLNTIELPQKISGIYLIRIEKQNETEVLKVPVMFD